MFKYAIFNYFIVKSILNVGLDKPNNFRKQGDLNGKE